MVAKIRDMEPSQRPRERLMEYGPSALSDAELLAVLLRTGRKGSGALEQSHELLREVGGVAGLARLSSNELAMRPGVGPAKSAAVLAALELGRRLLRSELYRGECLDRPELVGEFLVAQYGSARTEVFGAISLDAHHHVLAIDELSRGTRCQAPVDCAELFRRTLIRGADELLVFHNHPSGSVNPSRDDFELTRRLVDGGLCVGVAVVDHLLVGGRRWVSLRATRPDLFGVARM